MLKKKYLFGLIAMALMTSACSAKDAEAKTTAAGNVAKSTAVASASTAAAKPSVDDQFAAVFAKTDEVVKANLANNPKNYQDKVHFDTYAEPLGKMSTPDPDKVEVVEFFSYGCGACFGAEPTMHALENNLGDDVNFVRVPAAFNPYFEHLARGYYAAQALGAKDDAHIAIFKDIHMNKKRLQTPEALANFYTQYGIDKDKFLKAYNSFSVNNSIERSKSLVQKYQIQSVPNMVVDGKYLSVGQKAGSYETWAQIIGQLVDQERK